MVNVVIVESPAKAKTINKYLGSNYKVLASYGHVRDLPPKDGSVDPEHDFDMTWEVSPSSKKQIREIESAVKGADKLILATDPDREGEAISWHVLDILQKKKPLGIPVERVVFNAVTKKSILEAMENGRGLDDDLVEAYKARRALDYLVGFNLSPVLWRKLPGSRSAGRVQSVALRLIVSREMEIEQFKPQEYWTIEAGLQNNEGDSFTARLTTLDGKKLDKFSLGNEALARDAEAAVKAAALSVASVEAKPARRNPPPPFTTSTLQQEASRKLGFNASRTMQVAQRLYEGEDIGGETVGLITYMRTDGVQMTPEAIDAARDAIAHQFGGKYLPDSPRIYKTKAKNAQEAHEAIRPTDLARTPQDVARYLSDEQLKLYELVWKRAIASQMESASFERTTVELADANGKVGMRATGSVLVFDGFLTLYQEGVDDPDGDDDSKRLPKLTQGDAPKTVTVNADQHFTEPPPRFTEASLVRRMEELGIGRPSTYASTLSTLRDREYVHMDRNRFVPEDKGRVVTAFLEKFFNRYVQYDFTAGLEEKLDAVSAGEVDWRELLRDFWQDFVAAIDDTKELRITEVLDTLNDVLGPHVFPDKGDGSDPRLCPTCGVGQLSIKTGRYGAFIGCSNYPECKFTRPMAGDGAEQAAGGDKELGTDPETGMPVLLKSGRFGPYIQLGEKTEENEKPKRSGIPKGMDKNDVDFDYALKLLSLPRDVGEHPETGKMITAGLGRYGPFVLHDGKYANLDSIEEVFTVGINRAVDAIAQKAQRGRGRNQATVLKELGEHPDDGGPVQVLDGRYGPYIKHGKINATIPKSEDIDNLTLERAVELVAAKAAKSGKKTATKSKAKAKTKAKAKAKAKAKTNTKAKTKAKAKAKAKAKTKTKAKAKTATPADTDAS
ncbi:type I DNA topoisomerase [Pyruvatibacter mobilis]|uniref:type I DNA topoisomerase n=1 Tax=Pyruvatibacter mobilis TaxID=1712261 RepID=UPI003BAD8D0C